MLDSKQRLFVNISHHRDLSSLSSPFKASGRKALQVLIQRPAAAVADQDDLQDICLDRVKDEEEEASEAALFFDQPTPVIEMKSFLSTGMQKEAVSSNSGAQRSAQPHVFSSHELDDSFNNQLLHSPGQYGQQQSALQSVSQNESLSTPVVDPNFAPSFTTSHTLAHMESALFDPFQQEHAEFISSNRVVIGPAIPDTPSPNFALQYADPPQYVSRFDCPADQSTQRLSQLPESVLEIHRPSVSSVGPSESSSSSPPPSPKCNPDLKRKRSDSDCGKKGRMTKKQQFDALCSRKSQLEDENFNLKEKVDGYERACRRLKQMLYNRIKQQRA